MEERLSFCLNSQNAKVNRCRFHYLKNWFVTSCCNSFLLYCQLLVLSEKMNTSFWGSVASPFYPLEGNPLLS